MPEGLRDADANRRIGFSRTSLRPSRPLRSWSCFSVYAPPA